MSVQFKQNLGDSTDSDANFGKENETLTSQDPLPAVDDNSNLSHEAKIDKYKKTYYQNWEEFQQSILFRNVNNNDNTRLLNLAQKLPVVFVHDQKFDLLMHEKHTFQKLNTMLEHTRACLTNISSLNYDLPFLANRMSIVRIHQEMAHDTDILTYIQRHYSTSDDIESIGLQINGHINTLNYTHLVFYPSFLRIFAWIQRQIPTIESYVHANQGTHGNNSKITVLTN